jgi:hypothetical protein
MKDDTYEFGNEEGLSIAEKLSALDKNLRAVDHRNAELTGTLAELTGAVAGLTGTVAELTGRVSHLEPYADNFFIVRSAILDDSSWTELQKRRNEVVHGGNILADLTCIERQSKVDQDKASRWRESFETLYQVEYPFAVLHLPGGPLEVHEALNMRANVRALHLWTKSTSPAVAKVRKDIESTCDDIIREWSQAVENGQPIRQASAKSKASFQHARSQYQRNLPSPHPRRPERN